MSSYSDLFKEAALLQFTATCWSIDRKLPPMLLAEIEIVDYLKECKLILAPESTAPIREIIGKIRSYLRKLALPFPIRGCVLVPRKLIPEIQNQLSLFKNDYECSVESFLYCYPTALTEAQEKLGELFDQLDYPTAEQLKKRFRFEWRYLTIGPSTSRILPASIYQEEMTKFKEFMTQARQEAEEALRIDFVDLVSNLTSKLNGNDGVPKQLRSSAVENLHDFLAHFDDRNIFQDEQLETLVQQCRNIINGVSYAQLKNNVAFKTEIHNKMSELLTAIDQSLENLPRRKIRMADEKGEKHGIPL